MPNQPDYIASLIIRQLNGEITALEKETLQQWIDAAPANRQLSEQLLDEETLLKGSGAMYGIQERVLERLQEYTAAPVRNLFTWKRVMVAASVLAVFLLASYWVFFSKKNEPVPSVAATKDIPSPSSSRAILTLADGKKIFLDSAVNGQLVQQGNVAVIKSEDGKIIYQPIEGAVAALQYNTLDNPRGSKVIDMQLADGSHVWLNAGSSVTYPVVFTGNERKVTITGEAYFEVAHDAAKSFYVSQGDMSVQVHGTHFNVNAYDDEATINVTLLEGSVEVKNHNSKIKIIPGQQAVVGNSIEVNKHADLEQVMAWKNGVFSFNRTGIEEIMRQVSRWYDVEIVYGEGTKGLGFTGDIARKENVSQVLKMLEATGVLHFVIEGRRIMVKQ